MKIQRATPSDILAIQDLERKAHGEEVSQQYDVAVLVHFGLVFVAKEKQRDSVVGAILALKTMNDEIFVNDWVVDPKYQMRGIGTRLYQKLLEEARGKVILALVDEDNFKSIKAHQKLGFVVDKQMVHPYGENSTPALLLKRNQKTI